MNFASPEELEARMAHLESDAELLKNGFRQGVELAEMAAERHRTEAERQRARADRLEAQLQTQQAQGTTMTTTQVWIRRFKIGGGIAAAFLVLGFVLGAMLWNSGAGGYTSVQVADKEKAARASGFEDGKKSVTTTFAQVDLDKAKADGKAEGIASRNDEVTGLATKVNDLTANQLPANLEACNDACRLRTYKLVCEGSSATESDMQQFSKGIANMKDFLLNAARQCGLVAQRPIGGQNQDGKVTKTEPLESSRYRGDRQLDALFNSKKD